MKPIVKFEGKDTGVSTSSLIKSRKIRSDFLNKYGCVPDSILVNNRSAKRMDLVTDNMGGGYAGMKKKNISRASKDTGLPQEVLKGSGLDFRGYGGGGEGNKRNKQWLSAFPQNIGRIVTDIYCPENGVVYDPFAGHNSRMELVFNLNREYIGVDISHKFMEANRKIKDILINNRERGLKLSDGSKPITLIEGSSAKVDLSDKHADFTITSPPYWNIEWYGDEPEQLGNAKTYDKFLDLLFEHVKENYRILKPGSFCCWFVNDFRRDKKFLPYHIDTFCLLEDAGFISFNIYIVDLGNPIGQIFVQNIINKKLFPKRHEYCLVFKKE